MSSESVRIGAVVAEIEGLYAALCGGGAAARRERLIADLARAGRRLAELAVVPAPQGAAPGAPARSRWRRRRVLAARGAAWILARTGGGSAQRRR
ncbi:hypothetical protein ACFP1Z_29275 [Streptomyces gamaensis]|uniref:Uncharacterized protein n=1 Tax=Streptomyces gamaensis TaxID=1763542 RepID=A0ABW0ZCF5_9ACTN